MSETAAAKTYSCPGCGSMLEFEPEQCQLVCHSCGNAIPIPIDRNQVITEYPLSEAEHNTPTDWESPTTTVTCGGCGTKTLVPVDSGTVVCPFCGSKQLVRDEKSRTIRPESLIPFKISHKLAAENFRKWIGKKWFAPDVVRKAAKADKISGVYMPYWTYDAKTDYTWSAEAGTYYWVTEMRSVRGSDGRSRLVPTQVRKTRWRPVFGHGNRPFDDVPINASKNENREHMTKLSFAFGELLPYKPEFLLGFMAERYSVSVADGFTLACDCMRETLKLEIAKSIVADEVRNVQVDVKYEDVRFKHLLAPIWLSAFTFRDKVYRFVINGQNGAVEGRYPLSVWKIAFCVVGGLVLAALLYLLIQSAQATT